MALDKIHIAIFTIYSRSFIAAHIYSLSSSFTQTTSEPSNGQNKGSITVWSSGKESTHTSSIAVSPHLDEHLYFFILSSFHLWEHYASNNHPEHHSRHTPQKHPGHWSDHLFSLLSHSLQTRLEASRPDCEYKCPSHKITQHVLIPVCAFHSLQSPIASVSVPSHTS